jgi:MFS transporter, putative metabolite:H+ symporter
LGSSLGPVIVGFVVAGVGIQFVFGVFAIFAIIGALTTFVFGIETKGKVLEELSP